MPRKAKVPSKKDEPKVQVETAEESLHAPGTDEGSLQTEDPLHAPGTHEESLQTEESQHAPGTDEGSLQTEESRHAPPVCERNLQTTSGDQASQEAETRESLERRIVVCSLLESALKGALKSPHVSPEKSIKKENDCPVLLAALSSPSMIPTTSPPASQVSSPTEAMEALRLNCSAKAMITTSSEHVRSLKEQELPSNSRSRARSVAAEFESPYQTRSKTKRVRDKEQRSASEEAAKRTSKDKDTEKPL